MSISNIGSCLIPGINTTKEVKSLTEITSYPFYHGDLDGVSCEELLRGQPNGTYLIRNGEKPNYFYLSWVIDTDRCHFEHFPFVFSGSVWIRKNLHTGKSENLHEFIPIMMYRTENECFPLVKRVV